MGEVRKPKAEVFFNFTIAGNSAGLCTEADFSRIFLLFPMAKFITISISEDGTGYGAGAFFVH